MEGQICACRQAHYHFQHDISRTVYAAPPHTGCKSIWALAAGVASGLGLPVEVCTAWQATSWGLGTPVVAAFAQATRHPDLCNSKRLVLLSAACHLQPLVGGWEGGWWDSAQDSQTQRSAAAVDRRLLRQQSY